MTSFDQPHADIRSTAACGWYPPSHAGLDSGALVSAIMLDLDEQCLEADSAPACQSWASTQAWVEGESKTEAGATSGPRLSYDDQTGWVSAEGNERLARRRSRGRR